MLNVGASSPLNLHRKALQAKLNPSASNSSRSVIGQRSFYSSKSVTLDDHGATDLEGGNNHHPHSIPQNPSLASFQTEASPNRDGHDRDRVPPTVLNIRLVSGGVYGSERSRSRGRSSQRIAKAYAEAASDFEEGNSKSSALSYTVCNRTFRRGNPTLNATPDICFTVSFTVVVIEDTTRGYRKRACRDHTELEGRVAYFRRKNVPIIRISFHPPVGFFHRNGYGFILADTVTMDKLR